MVVVVGNYQSYVTPVHLFRKNLIPMNWTIKVQIVCDFAYRITNINAKWPSSCHDSTIYQESQLYQYFERHPTINSGILLCDSGYACLNTLLTPWGPDSVVFRAVLAFMQETIIGPYLYTQYISKARRQSILKVTKMPRNGLNLVPMLNTSQKRNDTESTNF